MFQTKSNTTTIVIAKNPKLDNVQVNVVIVVMTRSQALEQQVLKERELVKAKTTTDQ